MFKKENQFELVDNLHYYNVIASRSLVQKKEDLGALTISCTIGAFNFTNLLCMNSVSINMMLFLIYR